MDYVIDENMAIPDYNDVIVNDLEDFQQTQYQPVVQTQEMETQTDFSAPSQEIETQTAETETRHGIT